MGLLGCAPIPSATTYLPLAALKQLLSYLFLSLCSSSYLLTPPSPAQPLLLLLLQAMAQGITRILILLSVLQLMLNGVNQNDEAMQELLQQHGEQQRQEVACFLKKLEEERFHPSTPWCLLVSFEALLILVEGMLLWCKQDAEAPVTSCKAQSG